MSQSQITQHLPRVLSEVRRRDEFRRRRGRHLYGKSQETSPVGVLLEHVPSLHQRRSDRLIQRHHRFSARVSRSHQLDPLLLCAGCKDLFHLPDCFLRAELLREKFFAADGETEVLPELEFKCAKRHVTSV